MSRKKDKKWVSVLILALVVIAAAVLTFEEPQPEPTDQSMAASSVAPTADAQVAVHFIDVGQGDSILIQTPEADMLIDAADRGNAQTILTYVESYGVTEFEYVVATHPHADHIGSMDGVLNAVPVHNILMPRLTQQNTPTSNTYQKFLTAVKQSGAKVIAAKPGMTFMMDGAQFTVLAPITQSDDLNNMSVVLRMDWGGTSFLFTGDAETAVEKEILNSDYAALLDVDVLKLGHHGSSTSSSTKFLQAVTPQYGIVSCGAGNDYGHPHKETMTRMDKNEIRVLRTDKMGSIRFYSDGETLSWEADHA